MHMNFTSDGSERCSRGPATTRIPGKSEATMVACALNFECWSLKSVSDVNASIALATWRCDNKPTVLETVGRRTPARQSTSPSYIDGFRQTSSQEP